MDVERTIEFILAQHARNEAALAELIAAQEKSDRRVDRLELTVTKLARLGVKSRTKMNRTLENHEKWLQDMQTLMVEIGGKLNALIGCVDNSPRTSPQS